MSEQKAHLGQATTYHRGNAEEYPAIVTRVEGPKHVDVVYLDDGELVFKAHVNWHDNAAYGPPPDGGGGPPG